MTDYTNCLKRPSQFHHLRGKIPQMAFHPLCHCQKRTGPLLLRDQFIGSCACLIFTATFYGRVAVELKKLKQSRAKEEDHCVAFLGKKISC